MPFLPGQFSPSSPTQRALSRYSTAMSVEDRMSGLEEHSPATKKLLGPNEFSSKRALNFIPFRIEPLGPFKPANTAAPSTSAAHSSINFQSPSTAKKASPFDDMSKATESTYKITYDVKMPDAADQLADFTTTTDTRAASIEISPDRGTATASGLDRLLNGNLNVSSGIDYASIKVDAADENRPFKEVEELSKKKAKEAATWVKHITAVRARNHERWRINCLECHGNDERYFAQLRDIAASMAEVIRYWVKSAKEVDEQPLLHAISFGERKGERLTLQLKQVFALFPQMWQHILYEERWESKHGEESWLDENLMNVIVHLAATPEDGKTVFGLSLASYINKDMNEVYENDKSTGYLDHLIKNLLPNLPDTEGFPKSEVNTFTFPPETKKIVWFWNYDDNHWATIETYIRARKWFHLLYDSMDSGDNSHNWGGWVRHHFESEKDNLETVITEVSGFRRTKEYSEVIRGESPQQTNFTDCGVFTVHNTLCILKGQEPDVDETGHDLRSGFLDIILCGLQTMFGDLSRDQYEEIQKREDGEYSEDTATDSSPITSPVSGEAANIDPALPKAPGQDMEALSDGCDFDDISRPPSPFDGSNSFDELQEFITFPLPEAEMMTVESEESAKTSPPPLITSPLDATPNSRSSSPETVKILTHSSSAAPSPPLYEQIKDKDGKVSSPVALSKSVVGMKAGAMTRIPSISKNARLITPRSFNFAGTPEAAPTCMMRISTPSGTVQASTPPPIHDAMLPLSAPAPSKEICTSPPMHTASSESQRPSRYYPTCSDPFAIFPATKNMTMSDVAQRYRIMERLRRHELPTPDWLEHFERTVPEPYRIQAVLGFLDHVE